MPSFVTTDLRVAEDQYRRRQDEIAELRKELAERKTAVEKLEKKNREFKAQCLDPLLQQGLKHISNGADLGDAHAQWEMGMAYERGMYGVAPDILMAAEWYGKSAAQGHPMAIGALGNYYDKGVIGGKRDYQMAAMLWQRAAESGEVIAMADLGLCYWEGDGIKQDMARAFEWWKKGAEMDDKLCRLRLCPQWEDGETIIGNCVGGSNLVLEEVADMYRRGDCGLSQDFAKAAAWYKKSASMHNSGHSWVTLAQMYQTGKGVPKDADQTLYCLRQAAHMEHTDAQYALGQMYNSGNGTDKDVAEAMKWYTRAAERGHSKAQARLAFCLAQYGFWIPAAKWYKLAARQDDAYAQYGLSEWYSKRRNPLNFNKAFHWLARSALLGYPQAVSALSQLDKNIQRQLVYDCKAAIDICEK